MRVVRIYHAGRDSAHRERDRALVRAGVDVTLVVPTHWPGPDQVHDEPFEIVQLPVERAGHVNRHRFGDADSVIGVIGARHPDVLDLHEEPFSSVVHQVLRRIDPLQRVVCYAAQNIDKRMPPPFRGWERRALARIDGLYPCSNQAASVAVGKGFTGAVDVLPLAPPAEITPGVQDIGTDDLRLLLVGRFVPEKGIADAVRAFAAVAADRPTHLTLIGEGPEESAARHLATELGVADRLTVLPWLDAAALAEHYRNAHVVLAPSRRTRTWVEQFGRMVIEAQSAGAVVVAYATGSLPEVVGSLGVLVPDGDVQALAQGVRHLAAEPERWQQLRRAGLAAASRRTWDDVAAGQIGLYESTVRVVKRLRVRPQRAAARARFGSPAIVEGGGRPFALPILREDNSATRTLARIADAVSRGEAPRQSESGRLRVTFVDHVARLSGGELALLRLIGGMPDVQAHVILGEDGPLIERLEAVGATVEVLPIDPRARDLRRAEITGSRAAAMAVYLTGRYTVRLAGRIRASKPDVVHTNSLKAGYYGSIAARLAGRPVIWHLRDRVADDYLPAPVVRMTRLALRLLPSTVICNSEQTRLTLGEHTNRATMVVSSPVIHDPYRGTRLYSGRSASPVIGMVGRLAPWKGQDVVLRAMADLATDFPQVELRIVGSAMFGEDSYVDELHALVAELGLERRVQFAGFQDQVELELARMHILVHASVVAEPFGQVVVEGMAFGLPVVASAAGGPTEVITDGVDGILTEPGNVAHLSAALRLLLSDAELRARLGEAAIIRARAFEPRVIGAQMQQIYQAVLSRTAR